MIICIHFHNLNMNYPYQENVRNRHFWSKIIQNADIWPLLGTIQWYFGPLLTEKGQNGMDRSIFDRKTPISNIEKKIFQLKNDLIFHHLWQMTLIQIQIWDIISLQMFLFGLNRMDRDCIF